ncbi:MAG: hypothetical protein WC503_04000 [Candidatus Shapirobacteria bacterium]
MSKNKTELGQNFTITDGKIYRDGILITPLEGKMAATLPAERKKTRKVGIDKLGIDQTLGQDPEVEFNQDSGDNLHLNSSQEPEQDFDPSIEAVIVNQLPKKHHKAPKLSTAEKPEGLGKTKKTETKPRKPRSRRIRFTENP